VLAYPRDKCSAVKSPPRESCNDMGQGQKHRECGGGRPVRRNVDVVAVVAVALICRRASRPFRPASDGGDVQEANPSPSRPRTVLSDPGHAGRYQSGTKPPPTPYPHGAPEGPPGALPERWSRALAYNNRSSLYPRWRSGHRIGEGRRPHADARIERTGLGRRRTAGLRDRTLNPT
jgi:hypothetical protein